MAKNAAMSSRGMSGPIAEIAGTSRKTCPRGLDRGGEVAAMALEVLRLEGAIGDSDRREQRVDVSPANSLKDCFTLTASQTYTLRVRSHFCILGEHAIAAAVAQQAM
jgi:hypothetical protein